MRSYQYFLGWDVSQDTLNYCLRHQDSRVVEEGLIPNTRSAVRKFLKAKLKQLQVSAGQVFCLVEGTGLYTTRLLGQAHQLGLVSCLEDALRINKAYSRQLDKSDRQDARLISEYAFEKHYKLSAWTPPSEVESQLKGLHRRRRNLMKSYQSVSGSLQNSKKWDEVALPLEVVEQIQQVLEKLQQAIACIDERIEGIILSEEELKTIYDRSRSVFGLGPKNTIVILLETWFFQKITTAKACINYAGLRPVERSSGTSLNKRKRSSKKVNLALKTAFHQAAFTCSIHKPHFKAYYQRKTEAGKTHLQALNAIRNKICRALYACHRNEVMYDENLQSTLA